MKVFGAVWGVVLAVGVCAAQEGYTPLGEEPYEGQLPHEGEIWQGFSVEAPEGAERLVIEVEGSGVALFVKEGEPIQSSWAEEATASSLEGGGRERVVLESSGEPVLRACTYFVDVVLIDPEVPAKFVIGVEVQQGGVGEEAQPLGRQELSRAEWERVNGRVVTLYQQGRLDEAGRLAESLFRRAQLAFGERHPDTLTSLNNLAALYEDQGRHAEAEPLYRRCLEISREVLGERHPDTLTSLNNLAALYKAQGRYAEAEPLYRRCLEVSREVLGERHSDTLTSLNNLAALCEDQGRYAEAESLYRQCLEISREVLGERHPDTLTSLSNLAILYNAEGRYAEAEPLYRQCLDVRREVLGERHPDTLASLNNLAFLYQAQGRYTEAESLCRGCLEVSREVLGERHPDTLTSLNNLAVLYEVKGRYAEAEPLWEWSLVESAGWLDENLAGAHADARSHWAEERVKWFLPLLLSRATEAATPSDLSFRAAAYANGLVSRVARQVEGLARLQQGDSEVARLAQRLGEARRRLAQASLQQVSGTSGQDPDVALLRVERLRRLQAEAEGLAQELGRATSAFRPHDLRDVPSLEELTAPLPAQGARVQLVRYAPRDLRSNQDQPARYAALVLRKDGSRAVVDLGLAEGLEDEVGRYRGILLDPRTSVADLDLEESARGLYQHLWAPLEEALEGVEEVFLIADGALHLLPFEALLDEDYLYLGERLRITRAEPGAEERVDLERVAVVGNPAFGEGGVYGELPGAQLEGEALVAILSETKAKTDWLSGAAATRAGVERALEARPQIVHLATHGFFHPYEGPEIRWDSERVVIPEGIDPLVRCGLVFAGVNEGRAGSQWTASEVLGLDLEGVELVVLSACQTGVGEVVDGEGVNCLGTAFLYAGADRVLTTLWPVDDTQTRAFVQEFYERYLGGASAEEALRATKLAFLEDAEQPVRAHPRHWAGFVLLGR